MPTQITRTKLWAVGGGKGGIGKSILTLGLGISLARLGKRVILIDCDLGGANLHTLMGVRYPSVSLEHFLLKKVSRLEDTIIPTQVEGIGLICGADDILGAANPTYSQKLRVLNQIEDLPAQFVLLDLGAGTSFNLLDFFNYSPGKIALFTSQATSLQNGYGFIKSALYRKLSREFAKEEEVLKLLVPQGLDPEVNLPVLGDVLGWLKEAAPEQHAKLAQVLWDFRVFLVVNMVKNRADLKSPEIIQSVCADFLGVEAEVLGHLEFDPAVEAAVNQMLPFPLQEKKSRAAASLQDIALRVLKASRLPRSPWVAEAAKPAADDAVEAAPLGAQLSCIPSS
jgi:flagellar biosynthesis protein FlhG